MAKTHLLQAVCTIAMLAAVPALAQTNTPPSAAPAQGMPAAGNSMQNSNSGSADTMSPSANHNMGSSASDETHATHRSAMAHHMGMRHGQTDHSQDNAVNDLNDRSFQAAQKGETFGGQGSDATSGGMNNMSNGSMSGPNGSMSGPNGSMSNGSMSSPSGSPPSGAMASPSKP